MDQVVVGEALQNILVVTLTASRVLDGKAGCIDLVEVWWVVPEDKLKGEVGPELAVVTW